MAVNGEYAALLVEACRSKWSSVMIGAAFARSEVSQGCFQTGNAGVDQSIRNGCRSRNRSFIVTPMRGASTSEFARDLLELSRVPPSKSECATALRGTAAIPAAGPSRARSARRLRRLRRKIRPAPPPSPPSLRSCADSASPSCTISRIASARAFRNPYRAPAAVPKVVQDHLGVLRPAEIAPHRSAPEPPSRITVRPGALEMDWRRLRRLHQPHDAHHRASGRSPSPRFRCTG